MRHPVADIGRLLEGLYARLNKPEFIHPDPLEFLHDYPDMRDREIVGFIASSLAYGRVSQILKSTSCILDQMGSSPRLFLESTSRESLNKLFSCFKHRFTTGEELVDFLIAIKSVIEVHGSLRQCFLMHYSLDDPDITGPLELFVYEIKSYLHIKENSLLPCPEKGSACKRLHLFLRWMVRSDEVDPGGWDEISPSKLIVPLDVHMHRICLAIGMTSRKQADLKTAIEITQRFRSYMPEDPVRYDFALTRTGIRNDLDPTEIMDYRYKTM
ncbi:MAG TPA: TIGR02757 family protein [Desulfomonilia bacterium]|nr:TIGR02757 family protein [Desulfomonilia bacterium]